MNGFVSAARVNCTSSVPLAACSQCSTGQARTTWAEPLGARGKALVDKPPVAPDGRALFVTSVDVVSTLRRMPSTMGLIDSHAHLTFPELRDQVDDLLVRCTEAGVDRVITIGTDLADTRRAIALAKSHPDRILAAGGVHPHEAGKVSEADLDLLASLWDEDCVVGLGEMGLDYHYDFADRATQQRVFTRQLELAAGRPEPIIIHSREAFDDTIAILLDNGFEQRPVVFHCFTGTTDESKRIAKHGWRISFTGIVTFPKSTELQAIAKSYPIELLMVETDSPYLSPVPLRGKHPNEPARLEYTARFLADLRGISFEQIVEHTSRNTRSFFCIDR